MDDIPALFSTDADPLLAVAYYYQQAGGGCLSFQSLSLPCKQFWVAEWARKQEQTVLPVEPPPTRIIPAMPLHAYQAGLQPSYNLRPWIMK